MLVVADSWLRSEEGDNDLMPPDYSFFRMKRAEGETADGILILAAENCDAREGH